MNFQFVVEYIVAKITPNNPALRGALVGNW